MFQMSVLRQIVETLQAEQQQLVCQNSYMVAQLEALTEMANCTKCLRAKYKLSGPRVIKSICC
jgi:hypothetical protein